MEAGTVKQPEASPAVAKAALAYLDDCRARKLAKSTITRYTTTLRTLTSFLGDARLSQITVERLDAFRASRAERAAASAAQELQTVKTFMAFCVDREWMGKNPAQRLKAPTVDILPTLPFEPEEISAILDACDRIDNNYRDTVERSRRRARALVLLLLYSGFRISDAVKLERSAVNTATGEMRVRIMKTGRPLHITLPTVALEALAALPLGTRYFFWSGTAKLSTAVGSARRTVECLMQLAGIESGHPHRFRDTFSVTLLDNGADLRDVQLLLGHRSMKTTEKHYAPFVASTQTRLNAALATLNFFKKV